jgi:hypothetical protein
MKAEEKENVRVRFLHTNHHNTLIFIYYLPHPSSARPKVAWDGVASCPKSKAVGPRRRRSPSGAKPNNAFPETPRGATTWLGGRHFNVVEGALWSVTSS